MAYFAMRGDLAFLSLKKLKSKLDRVKNSGLPRTAYGVRLKK